MAVALPPEARSDRFESFFERMLHRRLLEAFREPAVSAPNALSNGWRPKGNQNIAGTLSPSLLRQPEPVTDLHEELVRCACGCAAKDEGASSA